MKEKDESLLNCKRIDRESGLVVYCIELTIDIFLILKLYKFHFGLTKYISNELFKFFSPNSNITLNVMGPTPYINYEIRILKFIGANSL